MIAAIPHDQVSSEIRKAQWGALIGAVSAGCWPNPVGEQVCFEAVLPQAVMMKWIANHDEVVDNEPLDYAANLLTKEQDWQCLYWVSQLTPLMWAQQRFRGHGRLLLLFTRLRFGLWTTILC